MAERLLHIKASPRGSLSRSAMVASRLLARLQETDVEPLDLFDADLPPFGGAVIEGRYALLSGQPVAEDAAADWQRIEGMVAHFLSFDTWLFSTPMWNFGIPYRMKHYVDLLTQPGLAFSADAGGNVIGHAAGRTAIIIAAGALDTRPESALGCLDHQAAYLEAWLSFLGATNIHVIRVMPTFGEAAVVDRAMETAYAEADALARRLSRPSRV